MPQHIAPMHGPLIHPATDRQLGDDHVQHTERLRPPQRRRRALMQEDPLQLQPDPLRRHFLESLRARPNRGLRLGRHPQPQRRLQPNPPQRPHRVIRDRAVRAHPQATMLQIGAPTQPVHDRREIPRDVLRQPHRHRVHCEIPTQQIRTQAANPLNHIDRSAVHSQPPDLRPSSDPRRPYTQPFSSRLRPQLRLIHNDVHFIYRNPQQPIPHSATNHVRFAPQIGRKPPQRRLNPRHRPRQASAHRAATAHRASPRGRCTPAR